MDAVYARITATGHAWIRVWEVGEHMGMIGGGTMWDIRLSALERKVDSWPTKK